jgi:hypothetical protein
MWDSGAAPSIEGMLVMEAGTSTHDRMQNVLLPKTGRLWGNWQCPCCHRVEEGCFVPKPCQGEILTKDAFGIETVIQCAKQLESSQGTWKYLELRIKESHPEFRPDTVISGRSDGLWVADSGLWYVLEIKSCSPEMFEDLSRRKKEGGGFELNPYKALPMPSHIFQGGLYASMLHAKAVAKTFPFDPGLCGGTVLMYVNRATYLPRTWVIPLSSSAHDRAIENISAIESLTTSSDTMSGPKKCKDRNSTYAKTCPFAGECFPYKRAPKKVTK